MWLYLKPYLVLLLAETQGVAVDLVGNLPGVGVLLVGLLPAVAHQAPLVGVVGVLSLGLMLATIAYISKGKKHDLLRDFFVFG